MRYSRNCITVLGFLAVILCFETAWSKAPSGIGAGGSLGLMVALDDASYYGIGTDIYPELGLWIEVPYVRVGGTLGLIWRERKYSYWSGSYSYGEQETILILPAMARLEIRPFSGTDLIIGPFIGGGLGAYLVADGPYDSAVSISARAGLEIPTDYFTATADLRLEPTIGGDSQLGAFMATVGMILKLPLE